MIPVLPSGDIFRQFKAKCACNSQLFRRFSTQRLRIMQNMSFKRRDHELCELPFSEPYPGFA